MTTLLAASGNEPQPLTQTLPLISPQLLSLTWISFRATIQFPTERSNSGMKRGRPAGRDEDFWFEAERRLATSRRTSDEAVMALNSS